MDKNENLSALSSLFSFTKELNFLLVSNTDGDFDNFANSLLVCVHILNAEISTPVTG